MLGQIVTAARSRPRVWFSDPDRMLSASTADLAAKVGPGKMVLVIRHSLELRTKLMADRPSQWVVIDQTPAGVASLPVFAPDLLHRVGDRDVFKRTVRDFLVDQTQDPGWPMEVESFPYRELAREKPSEFIRAYDDFRSGKAAGFTAADLVLIAAGAVLDANLFAPLEAFQTLELAFHSPELWTRLSEYFGEEEIGIVRSHLSLLRSPLGDLFGPRAQSARLASVALLVLSRHLDSPAQYLPNLSSALAPWQDCDPVYADTRPPAWFQEEVDRLDEAMTDGFLKVMRIVLDLDNSPKADAFIGSRCWSRRLRELALPYGQDGVEPPISAREGRRNLESLVPEFRGLMKQVEELLLSVSPECDRLRLIHPAQLGMARFVAAFQTLGLSRLPLLTSRLRAIGEIVEAVAPKPPGFDGYWKTCQAKADAAIEQAEKILKDFDFLLGRYLEAQYAAAVPAQIPSIHQILERIVIPSRGEAPDRPVAILLLDGMRYDLWQAIVRPHLERRFQCDEQVGMALLPSETRISRFGFFSGLRPAEFYEKSHVGGEIAACEALFKRLCPGHESLSDWRAVSAKASFAFATADGKLYGAVLDFADAIGHVDAWDMDFLAKLVQVWMERLDQILNKLPLDCTLWITTDHGQVVSGPTPIEIPPDLLLGSGNGYRSALVRDRLPAPHANHAFYLKARDLGYESDGLWAFPKPGYSFRTQNREHGQRSKFKPTENMRHSGLSAFEVFIPIARLRTRTEQVRVTIVPKPTGTYTVAMPAHIAVEVSASAPLQGMVELVGSCDGISPVVVNDLGPGAQTVFVPFTPPVVGDFKCEISVRWGLKSLPDPATVMLHVQSGGKKPGDALDEKLKKLFG
jgi:hypothetical protein